MQFGSSEHFSAQAISLLGTSGLNSNVVFWNDAAKDVPLKSMYSKAVAEDININVADTLCCKITNGQLVLLLFLNFLFQKF